jgi:hypothetical protein
MNFNTLLLDWRRYFMPKAPFTIAVRAMQYGRYGRDSEDELIVPLYVGYPEFVHGYGLGTFSAADCRTDNGQTRCVVFDRLIGSRMAVANIELRAPLRGLFSGQLEYGRIPIDVVMFADTGVAWVNADPPSFAGGSRKPVRSVGGAVRINVFGFVPLEISAAHPFDRIDKSLEWQISVKQGF